MTDNMYADSSKLTPTFIVYVDISGVGTNNVEKYIEQIKKTIVIENANMIYIPNHSSTYIERIC